MKNSILLLLLLMASMLPAQTINNPSFKARSGSINTITKVERTAENTKLYIHSIFRPHWWIIINKTEYLEDTATGKKYAIVGSEGIELEKETYMPDSGEMDFVLLFAPLPKETQEIHWLSPNGTERSTYNISLKGKNKKEKNLLDVIKGNWLSTDSSNEWTFGFYDSLAIMNNRIYQYETIQKKGKSLLIKLKDDKGNSQNLTLSLQKDGNCFIQKEKSEKQLFTRINKESKTSKQEPDFTQFFHTDTVRLQGYLNGYDPRLGFETGLIYLSNNITRDDYPTVITIHPDGRFESRFVINHPIESSIVLGNNWIPFYVEPGQTLTVYLDWEAILARSRARDHNFPIKNTLYMGPSAPISQAMNIYENLFNINYDELSKAQKELSPNQYKARQQPVFQRWEQLSDSLIQSNNYSGKIAHLIRNRVKLTIGTCLFSFLINRDYYASQDTTNQVLKIQEGKDYYDFLRKMPLNDETILANREFGTFINCFEYMNIFDNNNNTPDSISITYPNVTILNFLKGKGVKLTPEEEEVRKDEERFVGRMIMKKNSEVVAQQKIVQGLFTREKKLLEEYAKLYLPKPAPQRSQEEIDKLSTKRYKELTSEKEQILTELIGASMPFAWKVACVRELDFGLKNIKTREVARNYLDFLEKRTDHPFLLAEAERIFRKLHPEKTRESYELPIGKSTDIFRKIIEPHQGKVLFVDFWATTCAPCRGGIKATALLREKYKNHPEFQFIYITSEKESPTNDYNKFVEENLKGEASYRVSETEFNYLRELFQFNGIPHYRLIEKDGKVSAEKLGADSLAPYLEKRFGTEKK